MHEGDKQSLSDYHSQHTNSNTTEHTQRHCSHYCHTHLNEALFISELQCSLELKSHSCWLGLTWQSFTELAEMIDSVGRIVFPTSLFGCSDPVIYNGPGPCLIHTSPTERGSIQEAAITLSCLGYFIKTELRAKIYVRQAVHQTWGTQPSPVLAPLLTSNFRSVY